MKPQYPPRPRTGNTGSRAVDALRFLIMSIPTPILTVSFLFIVILSAEGLRYGSRKVNHLL